MQYVSRGGTKLEHTLKTFGLNVSGLIVLDVGSSTGGFVDCLLQHGAKKVYALDTCYGELAWKLRKDPRVVVMERQNVLFLDHLPESVDLITIDVTFTPLIKILPVVTNFLKPGGKIIALLKPQYENSQTALKNKGIVPPESAEKILDQTISQIKELGFNILGQTTSPILGGGGNKEYLIYLTQPHENN